jgi:hypothetical protein
MARIYITGRMSFPQLFKPGLEEFGSKYGVIMLLPPDYDLSAVKQALKEAAVEKWGPDSSKWPKLKHNPATIIRPASEKGHLQGYEDGWHFVGLNSKQRPGVVDENLEPVTDPGEVYGGRWAVCSVNAFAWQNKFGAGVSLGLNNVKLDKHDDSFSGRPSAKNDFEEFAQELPAAAAVKPAAGASSNASGGWDE